MYSGNTEFDRWYHKYDQPKQWRIGKPEFKLYPGKEAKGIKKSEELYVKPSLNLLKVNKDVEGGKDKSSKIKRILESFKVEVVKIWFMPSYAFDLYTVRPKDGIKVNKIKGLQDELSLHCGVKASVMFTGTLLAVTLAREEKAFVRADGVIDGLKGELPVALGKDLYNKTSVIDLAKAPHVLVAGATGQGKTVCLNGLILSLIYNKTPEDVQFVLIDPKRIELSAYDSIPYCKDYGVISEVDEAGEVLEDLCHEMEARYKTMEKFNIHDSKEFCKTFPYLVVIIDELADLMDVSSIETPLTRLAQKARGVGIHLVVATQRPSVNVITGRLKANFPARIAFRVSSRVDSRVILDQMGAEKLLGNGDMLYVSGADVQRIQGLYIDEEEKTKVCKSMGVKKHKPIAEPLDMRSIAKFVVENTIVSNTHLRLKFGLSYYDSERALDQLAGAGLFEKDGLVCGICEEFSVGTIPSYLK